MRDPIGWAVPAFRALGVPVKVHVLFIVTAVGLFFRQTTAKDNVVWWADAFLLAVALPFALVVVHELGHLLAARLADADPRDVVLWPLGGLTTADAGGRWRTHAAVAAGGPAANLAVCLAAAGGLAAGGFLPNPSPLYATRHGDPYAAAVYSYRDGRTYSSEYGLFLYKGGGATPLDPKDVPKGVELRHGDPDHTRQAAVKANLDWAVAPGWAVWLQRVFWVSWVLLLANLLPAFPLDGGHVLLGLAAHRTDGREGTATAAYAGFVSGLVLAAVAIAANETLVLSLAGVAVVSSWARLHAPDGDDGPLGYDPPAGYAGLDRHPDDAPRPRPRPANPLKRWLQARAARRAQRERDERQQEDDRMDQLLDKIARGGKDALTDEERRFMQRVSERYKNRS